MLVYEFGADEGLVWGVDTSTVSLVSVFVSVFSISSVAASLALVSSFEASSFFDGAGEAGDSFFGIRNLIAVGSTDTISPGAIRVFGFECY